MILFYCSLLLTNLIIFIYFKKFSKLINIFDLKDNKLKIHKGKVPLVGGTILFINYIIIFLFDLVLNTQIYFINLNLISDVEIFSLLFFLFSFYSLGFYDDKFSLSPNFRLIISIISVLLVINLNNGLIINNLNFSFKSNQYFLNNYSILFTIFCIIILKNSLNFYDGINCQTGILLLFIFFYLYIKTDFDQFYLINYK